MRVQGRSLAFAFALLLAGCSRGPRGATGLGGLPGPLGPFTPNPKLDSIVPTHLSYGSVVTINGSGFAGDPALDEVWLDGQKADVLISTPTALSVTHLVPANLLLETPSNVVVFTNGQPSNPISVLAEPRGAYITTELPTDVGAQYMTAVGDGSIVMLRGDGRVVQVTADGDVHFFSNVTLAAGAHHPVSRPDGLYYLAGSTVHRLVGDLDFQVMPVGSAAAAMAIDATGNVYVRDSTGKILVRDYVTGVVTPHSISGGFNDASAGMVVQGTSVYLTQGTDLFLAPTSTYTFGAALVTAMDTNAISGDGTKVWFGQAGVAKNIDGAGTITTFSGKTAGATVDEVLRGNATTYYRKGDVVWRFLNDDPNQFVSYVSPFTANSSVTVFGDAFGGDPMSCLTGDSRGGVFYGVHEDGTMTRIASDFCGHRGLAAFAGQFFSANLDDSVSLISASGLYQQTILPGGSLVTPLFVMTDAAGNLFVPNSDGLGGWRVTKLSPSGAVTSLNFIPSFATQPVAGAISGNLLVLAFNGSMSSAPADTGGALAAFGDPAFHPATTGLTALADGGFALTDGTAIWRVAIDGSATWVADSQGDAAWLTAGDGSLLSLSASSLDRVMP